ncbi:MAG: UDP-3-O-(3-hydroxymyristoyl)glucosamine N-acyltransferase [Gemmatimonadales bacterium]
MGALTLSTRAVADLVGGRLVGDGGLALSAVGTLDGAGAGTLAFLAGPKYLPAFRASRAAAVLLPEAYAAEPGGPATRIVVADPYRALQRVAEALYPQEAAEPGVHPTAIIGTGATFGREVTIGAYAVIGRRTRIGDRVVVGPHVTIGDDVTIGDETVIDPGVRVYGGAVLGRRVVLKAGAVIGGPGFGFMDAEGAPDRRLHVGRCLLEDDVEVGSNATVDRGSLGDTVIGTGTKLDNLVHVAHNVRLGRRCLVAGQTGFAGSVHLGDGVQVGGQVAINGHMSVGDRARIGGASAVYGNIPAGETWSGHPARPHRELLRHLATMNRLSKVADQLERLVRTSGADA